MNTSNKNPQEKLCAANGNDSATDADAVHETASQAVNEVTREAGREAAHPPSSDWAAARDAAIAGFLDRFTPDCADRDVLADLMIAITRVARDGAHRGDL